MVIFNTKKLVECAFRLVLILNFNGHIGLEGVKSFKFNVFQRSVKLLIQVIDQDFFQNS